MKGITMTIILKSQAFQNEVATIANMTPRGLKDKLFSAYHGIDRVLIDAMDFAPIRLFAIAESVIQIEKAFSEEISTISYFSALYAQIAHLQSLGHYKDFKNAIDKYVTFLLQID